MPATDTPYRRPDRTDEPVPDRVAAAIDHAHATARDVDHLERDLSVRRDAWYAAVRDAVNAARDADIAGAQELVAQKLGVSRQRVSELARRSN